MAVVTEAVGAAIEAVTGSRPGRRPAHDVARGDGAVRHGQARHPLRDGARRPRRGVRRRPSSARSRPTRSRASACAGMGEVSRSTVDNLVDRAKLLGAAGLVWMRVKEGGALDAPILKFLDEKEQRGHRRRRSARSRATSCSSSPGERRMTNHVLGILRLDLGRPPVNEGGLQLLWVVDFPLFEGLDARRPPDPRAPPVHDAAPRGPRAARLGVGRGPARRCARRPTTSCSTAGSSARAACESTRRSCSSRSSRSSASSPRRPRPASGSCSTRSGSARRRTPGFAFGVDRLVALLAGEENIREVIAFPKTQKGAGPADRRAEPARPAQLRELGLTVAKPKGKPEQLTPRPSMDLDAIDLTDLDRFADGFPHDMFTQLRREAPVWWQEPTAHTPGGEGFWADHPPRRPAPRRARPGDVLVRDRARARRGRRDDPRGPRARASGPGVMLNMCDPPTHTRIRGLVSRDFTPKADRAARPVPAGPHRAHPRRGRRARDAATSSSTSRPSCRSRRSRRSSACPRRTRTSCSRGRRRSSTSATAISRARPTSSPTAALGMVGYGGGPDRREAPRARPTTCSRRSSTPRSRATTARSRR